MNYRLMLEKTADLLINLAVASVAVSAFQGVWYGIVMALFLTNVVISGNRKT